MPAGDPGEGSQNTSIQLFLPIIQRVRRQSKGAIAADIARHPATRCEAPRRRASWPDLLPILSGLARRYAVCAPLVRLGPNRDHAQPGLCACRDIARAPRRQAENIHLPQHFRRLSDKSVDWVIFG